MKNNFKILINTLIGGSLLISACSKKIDDAYPNPNANVRQPIEVIFPSMIGSFTGSSSAAGSAYGLAGDALLIGRYIQFWGTYSTTSSPASQTSANSSNYDQMGGTVGASDNLGSVWAAHYYGMGQNLNKIILWGNEEKKWDYVGAAWAMRAWSMFESTNEYGEIILRQAFNASLQQFNYEQQSEVYDSVRVICYRALDYLNRSGDGMNAANFTNSDFFFNKGDLSKWKKFVYGILARSYAYTSNKSGYDPDLVIKYADSSCVTNADNITCKFQNTGITGTSNYFGAVRGNVNSSVSGIRQSAYIADLLSGNNPGAFTGAADPRAPYLIRENNNGTYKGITPWLGSSGLAANDLPQSFMGTGYNVYTYPTNPQTGRYIFRDEAEWPIMTASEMQFIKAEALIRKGNKPAALAAYTNAISMNFDMLATNYSVNIPAPLTITAGNKAAYLANPNVVPTNPNNLTRTHVMLQKYISMYAWGVQNVWADMRRYHYTDIDPETGAQVYAGFTPPSGTYLHATNAGKLVYRCRPRYNSEYLYNIPALTAIGAYPIGNSYHTLETWFSKP